MAVLSFFDLLLRLSLSLPTTNLSRTSQRLGIANYRFTSDKSGQEPYLGRSKVGWTFDVRSVVSRYSRNDVPRGHRYNYLFIKSRRWLLVASEIKHAGRYEKESSMPCECDGPTKGELEHVQVFPSIGSHESRIVYLISSYCHLSATCLNPPFLFAPSKVRTIASSASNAQLRLLSLSLASPLHHQNLSTLLRSIQDAIAINII